MSKASRTNQSKTTKAIIQKIKKAIDNGADWRTELENGLKNADDSIQVQKIRKSIIEYI